MDRGQREFAIDTIRAHIKIGDPDMLSKLMEYGRETGRLPASDLLRLWNGLQIEECSDEVIQNLKDFFELPNQVCQATPAQRIDGFLETIAESQKPPLQSVLTAVERDAKKLFHRELIYLNRDQLELVIVNSGCADNYEGATILSAIRRYLNWCQLEYSNIPAAHETAEIRPEHLSYEYGLLGKVIPTPLALKEIILATKDPNDINTDCVVIALYWLGLTEEEMYHLKTSDVDLLNGTIRSDYFGSISIPDELIDIFRRYQKNDIIVKNARKWRADTSQYFIKKFHLKPSNERKRMSVEAIRIVLGRFAKQYTVETGKILKIARTSLNLSGAFYRVYQRELYEKLTNEIIMYEARIDTNDSRELTRFKHKYETYKKVFFA